MRNRPFGPVPTRIAVPRIEMNAACIGTRLVSADDAIDRAERVRPDGYSRAAGVGLPAPEGPNRRQPDERRAEGDWSSERRIAQFAKCDEAFGKCRSRRPDTTPVSGFCLQSYCQLRYESGYGVQLFRPFGPIKAPPSAIRLRHSACGIGITLATKFLFGPDAMSSGSRLSLL